MARSAMLAGMEQNSNSFLASMLQVTEGVTAGRLDTGIRNKYNDSEYENAVVRFPADRPSTSNPYGDRYASVEIGRIAEVTASIMSERSSSSYRELEYQINKLKENEVANSIRLQDLVLQLQLIRNDNASLRSAIQLLTDAQTKREIRQKKNKQRGATNVQNTRISS